MTKYNLIISFKDFNDKHKNDIIMVVSPVVGSENFSYLYNSGLFFFHFKREMTKDEIKSYVHDAFYGNIYGIFVSETDNMSVFLPDDDEKWFFDIDNPNSELNLSSVNMTNVKNGTEGFSILEFLENEDDDDDEDDIIDIIRRSKNKIKIPTLDDLLEKIYDQGLETLTEEEQQILKTYIK